MTITDKFVQLGNYTPGRDGHRIQWLVLHTEDGNNGSSWAVFNDPSKQRSAQYLVGENGEVIHAVSDGDTAWGAANWPVNQGCINIEHEDLGNYNDAVRTDAEYQSSAELVADLCRRFGIPCVKVDVGPNKMPLGPGIVLHKEVSQSGTACPDGLDWQRIIRQAQAILGGVSVVPAVLAAETIANNNPGYTELNRPVTVNWQNLQVRVAPATGAAGGQANTPDGMLHGGNVITITGWTRGERVAQNGADSDVWLRSVWGHWLFAAGTNFPLNEVGALAPLPAAVAPVEVAQAATPAPPSPSATPEPPLQSGIEAWHEDHKVVYTKRAGITVDTLSTGAPQKEFGVGQRIDQSGTFTVAGKDYVRTEFGFQKGTWNGLPTSVFEEIPAAPLPVVTSVASTPIYSAVTGPALDGIVKPAPVPVSVPVQTVPAETLNIRQRIIQAVAALAGGGADVLDFLTSFFNRK